MKDDHSKPDLLDNREASIEPDLAGKPAFRRLTPDEISELRRESAEAGAWMRAELAKKRRL